MPKSIAELHPRFLAQIAAMVEQANAAAKAIKMSGAVTSYQPDGGEWSGDIADLVGQAKAFDRSEVGSQFQKIMTGSIGNVGDLCVLALQGDFLGAQERAFRGRHTGFVRAQAHAAARLTEHGKESGAIKRGFEGYIHNILKRARS